MQKCQFCSNVKENIRKSHCKICRKLKKEIFNTLVHQDGTAGRYIVVSLSDSRSIVRISIPLHPKLSAFYDDKDGLNQKAHWFYTDITRFQQVGEMYPTYAWVSGHK